MGIGKINSIAAASLAKVNSIAKASISKINSITASFFTDNNAVSRSLTAGTAQAIYFTDTADTFNFQEDDAWTISFWVKAGWSAANRGNIGDGDFTMITMTKAAADAASSIKIYWNTATLGTPTVTKDETLAVGMSDTNDRLWSLGTNGVHGSNDQTKPGDDAETVYNDLSFWNAELTAAEVSELYNSGTRLNAETHSAQSNLIGYWKFESDGSATVSSHDFTIAGDSNITSV